MSRISYEEKLQEIFQRFPSVQKADFKDAYKPGLDRMMAFDRLLGSPSQRIRTIHVAGTNGKGTVANMLAAALAADGSRVGLYTSPHLVDFRERARIIEGAGPAQWIPQPAVEDFIFRYEKDFDELDLSFFEITTGLAFKWFSDEQVDWAVIETGLGGRLDSTNIITPEASVITSIGLDHCALLGGTREAIAAEKAGIFKPGVPAVVGERDAQTAGVFEEHARRIGCSLHFASDNAPSLWADRDRILAAMDLRGACREENLRTVLTVLDVLGVNICRTMETALCQTAARMDFHGRWEKVHTSPDAVTDIGHNPPAIRRNVELLDSLLASGEYDSLVIVYGVMADKDLASILPLLPRDAHYFFVAPDTARALPADALAARAAAAGLKGTVAASVSDGVSAAFAHASELEAAQHHPLIYIGGSTFVVSEAMQSINENLTI